MNKQLAHDAERQAIQAKVDKAAADVRERDEEIAQLEEAQVAHYKVTAEMQAKLIRYQQQCHEQQRELNTIASQLRSAEDRAAMLERLFDQLNHSAGSDQKEGATV